jgi:hypothetical protein
MNIQINEPHGIAIGDKYHPNLSQLWIENFDRLILMIKKWPNDACVGCEGEYKFKNMIYFLTLESFMIEESNKFIEEQGLFEEGLDLDF